LTFAWRSGKKKKGKKAPREGTSDAVAPAPVRLHLLDAPGQGGKEKKGGRKKRLSRGGGKSTCSDPYLSFSSAIHLTFGTMEGKGEGKKKKKGGRKKTTSAGGSVGVTMIASSLFISYSYEEKGKRVGEKKEGEKKYFSKTAHFPFYSYLTLTERRKGRKGNIPCRGGSRAREQLLLFSVPSPPGGKGGRKILGQGQVSRQSMLRLLHLFFPSPVVAEEKKKRRKKRKSRQKGGNRSGAALIIPFLPGLIRRAVGIGGKKKKEALLQWGKRSRPSAPNLTPP